MPRSQSSLPNRSPRNGIDLLRICDGLSEALIYFMIVFSPWAFGTTPPWAVSVMNGFGYALGILWIIKWQWRLQTERRLSPPASGHSSRAQRFVLWALGILTFLILAYVLTGAINARATYYPADWRFDYHPHTAWLPHSYDQARSWRWFWNYLALACAFWAIRDWLAHDPHPEEAGTPRWQRLLWVVSINGALVSFQGLLQRAEGSRKLLWLVEPRVNKSPESFFGPFAYRANAAQYLNLIWPTTLALWWSLTTGWQKRRSLSRMRHVLLPCAAAIVIGAVVSASRGGAMVAGGTVILSCLIMMFALKGRSRLGQMAVGCIAVMTISAGWILGWDALGERMKQFGEGLEIRESMFETARQISDDYPLYGTGAGSFDAIFQLYRSSSEEYWPAQLHNDWLETLITFGWLGSVLVWTALALGIFRPLAGGTGIKVRKAVVGLLWVALGGCLVHARYDFPFQIYSILFLFILIVAMLSSARIGKTRRSALP